MMGHTLMMVSMPKPSAEPAAMLKPMPMESTKGTVTGPVVTPALSHAIACMCPGERGRVWAHEIAFMLAVTCIQTAHAQTAPRGRACSPAASQHPGGRPPTPHSASP